MIYPTEVQAVADTLRESQGIAESLGLEIGQLVTHIIGFLVALWILKRFAWKPLLGLMEQRREAIKSEFDRIDEKNRETERLQREYEDRLKNIENEARLKIQEAMSEGSRIAMEMKEQARSEAQKIMTRAREEVKREIDKARVELRNQVVDLTIMAAEKIIAEELDDARHRELVDRFISEIDTVK